MLYCRIITPDGELFSGQVAYARVPGARGSFGILAGHQATVSLFSGGIAELWLDPAGEARCLFSLEDGLVKIADDQIVVLGHAGRELEAHNPRT